MQLLAATANAAQAGAMLADRIPRLFPYFRHTLASVRRSCVQCLDAQLQAHPEGASLPLRNKNANVHAKFTQLIGRLI